MRDLARLASPPSGAGEGSGVVGVDVQRIRRSLGLRPGRAGPTARPTEVELDRDGLSRFEMPPAPGARAALIERTGKLPPSRPLAELDRALPTTRPRTWPRSTAP